MTYQGDLRPAGTLGLRLIRADDTVDEITPWPRRPLTVRDLVTNALPHDGLPPRVNAWRRANRPNVTRGLARIFVAHRLHVPHVYGQLYLSLIREGGQRLDLGLAGTRVITTAGVRYVADDMNAASGGADATNFKFHGLGTGTNAESVADTALQTELTTQYAADNTRPTGSQASATVSTNATYTTVGTITVDATVAATEHGIFTVATAASGTLLDRTVFSVVNMSSGDALQATYVLTLSSGG